MVISLILRSHVRLVLWANLQTRETKQHAKIVLRASMVITRRTFHHASPVELGHGAAQKVH